MRQFQSKTCLKTSLYILLSYFLLLSSLRHNPLMPFVYVCVENLKILFFCILPGVTVLEQSYSFSKSE